MEEIKLAVYLGSFLLLAILLVTVLIILFAQKKKREALLQLKDSEIEHQKELAINNIQAHEDERQHIGQELHDDLGQQLASVKMQMESGVISNDLSKVELAMDNMSQAISKVSNISRLLYPVVLKKFGLVKALEHLTANTEADITLAIHDEISKIEDYNMHLHIYRIYQELISNSIKHSKSTSIQMKLSKESEGYLLSYSDDGVGFDYENSNYGLGLHNIKIRVDSIGGNLEIKTAPDEGFNCTITFNP